MSQPFGIIYKITNTVNGKVYVGQTVSRLAKRWREHKCHAGKHGPNKHYLHKAMHKYGHDKFSIEIIDQAFSAEELSAKEMSWISILETSNRDKGYNLTLGGEGFRPSDPEQTRARSERQTNWWKNPDNKKIYTEEVWTEEKRNEASRKSLEFYSSKEGLAAKEVMRAKITKLRNCEWCGIELNGRQFQKHTRFKCPNGPKDIAPISAERRYKCGNAMRGTKRPPEEVERRRRILKERFAENPWFIPRPSEDGRKRAAEATKKRMDDSEFKKAWAIERKRWWAEDPAAQEAKKNLAERARAQLTGRPSTFVWTDEARRKTSEASKLAWEIRRKKLSDSAVSV
jgi:group I intron endonuclease